MKIDVHSHFIPEKFYVGDNRVEIARPGSDEIVWKGNRGPAYVGESITSVDMRLREMDREGVDIHVLSVAPGMFNYELPADQALAACQAANDALAETVSAHPDRFVAIANLPLQAPDLAAAELQRAVKELDLRGLEMSTNIAGMNLDDPGLAPFWAVMQDLDVPAFLHPTNVLGQDRLEKYHLGNLIGNPTDTAVAAASLIFGGVLKTFPRLKFYLAHGGGTCPYLRGRWEHGWRVRPEGKVNIQNPPSEYFGLLYFDTLAHSLPALNYLVETMGPERVMLGTDYPYDMADTDPVKSISSLPHTSNAEKEMIFGGTAQRLFRIGA